MVSPGDIHVWRIDLDSPREDLWPPPEAAEAERAARFATALMGRRYLRSHGALRAILRAEVGREPRIGVAEGGKPWLPDTPRWRFNLSHSRETALVAVALDVEVGVDVEWNRPHPTGDAIASRYFPPAEAAAFLALPAEGRQREFFRLWTRLEARWKALGVGLRGAGREIEGPWTVQDLTLDDAVAAAVAAPSPDMRVFLHAFGDDQ